MVARHCGLPFYSRVQTLHGENLALSLHCIASDSRSLKGHNVQLTNWLDQLCSLPIFSQRRPAGPSTRRTRQRLLSYAQRRLELLEPRTVLASDFGDAPDTSTGTGTGNYQTLLANGGPSHVIDATQTTLFMGARVDSDANGVPGARANGDDTTASPNDEDGLIEPAQDLALTIGTAATVRVRATNVTATAATLYGWIDINRDGVFDNATERSSIAIPTATNKGTFTLTFPTIATNTTPGSTFARFRLSTDTAAANSTGVATGGEVEDYIATIAGITDLVVDPSKSQKITDGTNGGPLLATFDNFGFSVTSIGDLDGDGIVDLAAGAISDDTGGSERGAVYILLMKSNGTARSSIKIAHNTNGGPALANDDLFGTSITPLGDLDGDGVIDLAVGADVDDTGGPLLSNRGAVHVLFLNANGTVKSTTKIAHGTNGGPTLSNNDSFGNSTSAIGDLDGDGVTDLAVGAIGDDTNGSGRGAVHVLLLNSNGTAKSSVKIASGTNGGPTLTNGDYLGVAIASLGDLNGDGITDIAAGASRDDTGGTNRGAVHVLMLNSNGTAKSTLKIASGLNGGPVTADNDRFGASLAAISDLDGDGITDLAIGAFGDDTGGSAAGAVHLMRLNANGTAKNSVKVASGTNGGPTLTAGDYFGRTVASLGDLDGDGATDLAVGAFLDDTGGLNSGAVHVLFLNGQNPPPSLDYGDARDTGPGTSRGNYETLRTSGGPSHTITSTQATLYLGARVDGEANAAQDGVASGDDSSKAPDDEDGLIEPAQDLLLTVGTAPAVRVRATNTTGSSATLYGWIDFNRDGIFDNATERTSVSVPTATTKATFTLNFPIIPTITTAGATYARFRLSNDLAAASPIGPANGGEVEDYTATITVVGGGTVLSSKSKKITHQTNGGPTLDHEALFGFSVASLGDVDGDGVADLAVGAYGDNTGSSNAGAVHVLFMNSNGTVKNSVKIANQTNGGPTLESNDYFGNSVAALGDFDGDGVPDLAVGAYGDDTGGTYRGAVYILLLTSSGSVKSSVKLASGLNGVSELGAYGSFGSSVSSVGDLDGDGVTDITVGASRDSTAGNGRGVVYVQFMNSNGTVKSSVKLANELNGGPTLADNDNFGQSITSLGDLDGDGVTDLAVGASGDDTEGSGGIYSGRGAVHILRLNANGTIKSNSKIASNTNGGPALAESNQFGSSVASLGDLDGDGVTDLAVGAYHDSTGGAAYSNRGAVHVLRLNANGTAKSSLKLASDTNGAPTLADNDFFGASVANIGDLDGDGLTDIAVGAFADRTAATEYNTALGAVHVLFLRSPQDVVNVTVTGSESVRVTRAGDNVEVRINDKVDDQYTVPAVAMKTLTIQGGSGNNSIDLSGVTTSAFPALTSVAVSGNDGNDSIIGSQYADLLDGGLGDDTLTGGNGVDTLAGGGGSADVLSESTTTNLTLSASQLSIGLIGSQTVDSLTGFEKALLLGGGTANVLDASTAGIPVSLFGGGGNDSLIAGNQADNLDGQAGNDTLTGGSGNDTLNGGAGTDGFRDVAYTDAASGQIRNITLTSSSLIVQQSSTTLSSDTLLGFEFADLTGGAARDFINASSFTNSGVTTISGGGGNDVITGTPGADMIFTLTGADSISGGAGGDTIFGGSGNDTINGGDGADNLNGQNGNDALLGDADNDVLVGGAGLDTLTGGLGNDFLSGQTEAGLLNGSEGNDTLQGNTAGDTLNGDAGDDRLFGLQGDDVINAGDGADSLVGAIGNDSLNGGAGLDTLQGDLGNDTLNGGSEFDRINEVFDTNVTIVGITVTTTGLGADTVVAIERIQISGGAAANFFDARQATVPVFLSGGMGNDTLLGGSKGDGVLGNEGDDVLSGGAGTDIIDGGDGTDYVLEKADTDFTVNGATLGSSATIMSVATGTDSPVSVERIVLIGGASANSFNASAATIPVVLIGGPGNDTLIGGTLADTLTGGNRNDATVQAGDGADSLDGGPGADVYENDVSDTFVSGGGDTSINDVFTLLPNWVDAI